MVAAAYQWRRRTRWPAKQMIELRRAVLLVSKKVELEQSGSPNPSSKSKFIVSCFVLKYALIFIKVSHIKSSNFCSFLTSITFEVGFWQIWFVAKVEFLFAFKLHIAEHLSLWFTLWCFVLYTKFHKSQFTYLPKHNEKIREIFFVYIQATHCRTPFILTIFFFRNKAKLKSWKR